MSLPSLLANASQLASDWGSTFNWTDPLLDNSSSSNRTTPLPYDETPADIRQYLLIVRLVLLGIGTFDTLLLLLVYCKCASIITSCVGVYVANISIAALIDMTDISLWALKEFGYRLEDLYQLPWWVYRIAELPQMGLPTTSLFLMLLIIDRLFATCFAGCHRGCYGYKPSAVVLTILIWIGSFFMTFILVFHDQLFPHDALYEHLRFIISYLGPLAFKLLLLIVLFVKRRVVPDSEQSQAMIHRQRESLYYVLTLITIHIVFSVPYYAVMVNQYFHLMEIRIDEWINLLTYTCSQLPIVLNPILCLSIDPEFRDSLVYLCTCSGRSRRDLTDLCDDHAESQPLAPMATSPVAEEKEHLDEADA
ncbi:hypothetical protein RDWZM_010485 [Blomia tropicalis]|uniref:G-protein coupled receptors family 1 profile domain-containing protein n=1 Tax=Blomia tropicalis TaxID=40697 RepID=A0A9Q0LYK5_BLOTA|nr:hypothetical protein BLOT_010194 [Blomia tropicalis]KAJ6215985.1 hypothetical protein RDWZM_010485 [Blomia tropicalis]